jgi:hypothetical protein
MFCRRRSSRFSAAEFPATATRKPLKALRDPRKYRHIFESIVAIRDRIVGQETAQRPPVARV